MTQEEALKIIEYTFLNADGHLKPLDFDYGGGKGIVEALKIAIEALSQPSLPSNLNEAAEKYSNIPHNFGEFVEIEYEFGEPVETIVDDKVFVKDAFKAGAEWMAGRGQTFAAHFDDKYGCAVASGVKLPFVLWNTYEDGDALKVQIRKK